MSPDLGDMIQQNQNFPLHKDKDKDLLKDLVVIMMVDTTAILIREEVVMDTIGPLLDMAEEIMVVEEIMVEAEGVEVEMEEMVAEEMEAIIKAVAVGMIAIVIVILIGTAENLQEEEEDMAEEEVVEEEEVEDMIDLPPTMIEE